MHYSPDAIDFRPTKRRGILSKREYDSLGHGDVDAIADTLRRRAVGAREHSREGLPRSVAHVAAYDDDAFGSIVIDPPFLDSFKEPSSRGIVDGAIPELRKWLSDPDVGKAQRARYALIRFMGADSDLVREGLSGSTAEQSAVIYALSDPHSHDDDVPGRSAVASFPTLPASLLPALRPLLAPKALKKRLKETDSWADFGRLVAVLVRIASDDVPTVLLEALDVEELRNAVASQLVKSKRVAPHAEVSPAIRARYERVMSAIEGSRKAGLPNRIEVAIGGALAALVGRDRELARLTLKSFDLLPVGKSAAAVETLLPFVALLEASVDLLEPNERATLAAFMMRDPVERLPAAAAAWVRLPASEAKPLADRFKTGDRALEGKRWERGGTRALVVRGSKRRNRCVDPGLCARRDSK